jgi:pyridoxamine 5'-phosphate oxidase
MEYPGEGLSEDELAATPLEQVRTWVADAQARQADRGDVTEPTALALATVDADGRPNVRTVLMRFLDERGPGFVTDLDSTKSREITATGGLAAALTWPAMYRAIRFRGRAVPVSRPEIDTYFRSRPWGSRISAWASDQSRPVADRTALLAAYDQFAARYPDTGSPDDVPVPDGWGGWRIDCDEVELWAGRRDRLHDRLVFTRTGDGDLGTAAAWTVHRRQP